MVLKSRFAKVSSFLFISQMALQEIASLRFTIVFFVCVSFLIALKSSLGSVSLVFKRSLR